MDALAVQSWSNGGVPVSVLKVEHSGMEVLLTAARFRLVCAHSQVRPCGGSTQSLA